MKRPVVNSTEGHGEFVACLAAEGAWLHEPEVVRIRGLAGAEQARLLVLLEIYLILSKRVFGQRGFRGFQTRSLAIYFRSRWRAKILWLHPGERCGRRSTR